MSSRPAADVLPESCFFEGCSWGCIYYLGAYVALRDTLPPEHMSRLKWGGYSSGALVALGAALGKTPAELRYMYNDLAEAAREYGVWGKMSVYHAVAMGRWIPREGSEFKALNGKLYVGVSRVFSRFELISEWDSNQALLDTLHASMHVPFYMTHLAPVQGRWAIDGGFGYHPSLIPQQLSAVTVNVDNDGMAHVHPDVSVPLSQKFSLPCSERVSALIAQGNRDMTAWLQGARQVIPGPPEMQHSANKGLVKQVFCIVFWFFRSLEACPSSVKLVALVRTMLLLGVRAKRLESIAARLASWIIQRLMNRANCI